MPQDCLSVLAIWFEQVSQSKCHAVQRFLGNLCANAGFRLNAFGDQGAQRPSARPMIFGAAFCFLCPKAARPLTAQFLPSGR